MDWESFVKDFVSEVDYDIGKQLVVETAEMSPEEVADDLAKLVAKAKQLYAKYNEGGSQ